MRRYMITYYGASPNADHGEPVCYVMAEGEGMAEDKGRAVAQREGMTFESLTIEPCDAESDPIEYREGGE